jgi:hypothetical protein
MSPRAHRRFRIVAVLLGLLAVGATAQVALASLSPKVIKALRGQLIISDGPIETAGSDAEVIAAFKAAHRSAIKGSPNAEDVQTWFFHYTAFLKQKGFSSVALEFHVDGKYVADRRLTGIDPSLTVLQGTISITEDDGPAKGKKYALKLVGRQKGKDVVLSTTTLQLN